MITFQTKPYALGAWTILKLPEEASDQLPSRGQVAVKGTINGHAFEKVLEPDGRWGHWFKLDESLQKQTDITVGDTVSIKITATKDWPEPSLPNDFKQALETAPSDVKALWPDITPMARWEWIRWINATNATDTRKRRVEVSISKMHSGERRPCCFNRAACTDPELSKSGRLIEEAQVAF